MRPSFFDLEIYGLLDLARWRPCLDCLTGYLESVPTDLLGVHPADEPYEDPPPPAPLSRDTLEALRRAGFGERAELPGFVPGVRMRVDPDVPDGEIWFVDVAGIFGPEPARAVARLILGPEYKFKGSTTMEGKDNG